tara:strand:- start:272 stop:487 length:216 start_codon:yes stop_codon:yes gene_type:complete
VELAFHRQGFQYQELVLGMMLKILVRDSDPNPNLNPNLNLSGWLRVRCCLSPKKDPDELVEVLVVWFAPRQ